MLEYILALIGGVLIGNSLTTPEENDEKDYKYEPLKLEDGGDITIARTILNQLGGANKLVAMTGAYNFRDLGNGLSFRIKNQKANYIKIIMNGKDLYDVEIGRVRGNTYKVVAEGKDIYYDMVIDFIESNTGMYLTLFADGGDVKFKDKVSAVEKKLVGKEVPTKYKKEYGKKYDKTEAKQAAQKIIGAQVSKYE